MRGKGSAGRSICLVTPGYLSSTPRVVREADALSAAGYDVRVAFTQGQLESIRRFDDELVAGKPWRTSIFRWSNERPRERWAFFGTGIRQRLALAVPFELTGVTERAEGRVYPELVETAACERADLYIGHYPVGLAAAAVAARRFGARVGYDVEDLYADVFPDTAAFARPRTRIRQIESRYVPACAHVTAVSEPVAEAFARRFGVRPVAIHNCHPLSERARLDGRIRDRRNGGLSLFWFSQTVGLDRGLQDAIRAIGLIGTGELHIRGAADVPTRSALEELARSCGASNRVHFHPPCPPGELLSRAAEHDVGLALELADTLNHRLTVSNKLFLYMTAGLAVAATDVPGQRGILETCPEAGRLYNPGDSNHLAEVLRGWANDDASLARAKDAALNAARLRWNAEAEGQRLVAAVDGLFQRGAAQSKASGE